MHRTQSRQPHRIAIEAGQGEIAQHATIDLDFDLSGVEVEWKSKDGKKDWAGWLPSFHLDVAKQFTAGSAPHDALWGIKESDGELARYLMSETIL